MVLNPNWVPPSAMPPTNTATTSTEPTVGDSSNAPEQNVPPAPSIIRLRIWPVGTHFLHQSTMLAHRRYPRSLSLCMTTRGRPTHRSQMRPESAGFRKHKVMIRKIYEHQVVKRLQQMMSDVHQGKDHLTSWIRPNIKRELVAYFRYNDVFKCHRLTNVTNRALPRSSRYTNESATFVKMKSRLSKSLDREATLAETFKYTHALKANKEIFDDERSAEEYTQRLEAATQQSQLPSKADEAGYKTSTVDPNRIYHEITSEPHKNHRFGLGSFFANGLRSSALAAFSASAFGTSHANPQKVVNLREEVQKPTQELHQQVEQS
ncbi:uncharacterized protein DS421_17g591430 [Arachis hypogaea]|nr:uncharacterized protein DS421_17g591430 [Arachis hypogaea]